MRAGAWGIAEGYHRADGQWVESPPDTVAAILESMGADQPASPDDGGVVFARPGDRRDFGPGAHLLTEDGSQVELADGLLPPDLPLGYHTVLRARDDRPVSLVVSPGICLLPDTHSWGWTVQLYAARSTASWGFGDLADLRTLARWSARDLGAGFVLLNPLHAPRPGLPQAASPYFPSSRRFRNPLYLRIEDVPGAADSCPDLRELAAAGRALNNERCIDRDAVYRLKLAALEQIWERFPGDPGFDAYRDQDGSSLAAFATFCALGEHLGSPWTSWPEEYRHPDSPAVAEFRQRAEGRVRFHEWLQWLVDGQLGQASSEIPVVNDLAVGSDPSGADAWMWQDALALDMSVGAPPDEFNSGGQDWGVPPFDPWRLRRSGYLPFIETVRASLRHSGGIRLDHVMGLFRLFWIPRGRRATEGTYVRYPAGDLLDIVALESHRAGAYVVGEDLGTVQPEVRTELAARNVLSYRLLWFEPGPPSTWPGKAMAAVTTHDLPTVAGLWTGSDLRAQEEIGLHPNVEGTAHTRARLEQLAYLPEDAPVEEVVVRSYTALGESPCLLLGATLDDALAVEERPNMPGTIDEWPNWSLALPAPLEQVMELPGPARIAEVLSRRPDPLPDRR